MTAKLQQVTIAALPDMWPWVREGLEVVQRRGRGAAPEDVYHALRTGAATLATYEDVGFLVLQSQVDPDGSRTLFVWSIYGHFAPVRAALLAELDALAKAGGHKRVRMQSPRRWDATGDFELVVHVYEREIL